VTGIIILAAGASSRMGQPKQLLPYHQQTLLQRAIQAAVAVPNVLVIVVIGANQTLITPNVNNSSVILEYNPDWQQGMASSIRIGIKRLIEEYPTVQNALLMLCDQPFVDTALLQRLIDEKLRSNSRIVASAYQNTMGAPVLFDRSYFNELLALQGQEGAKKLLIKYSNEVTAIPFEKGAIDIDTPADYERLLDLE
jgi:molybdenum cofactor cytidylyltransferase